MALAGPAAEVLPVGLIFLVAGTVCPVMAVVAMIAARMRADEHAHPLEDGRESVDAGGSAEGTGGSAESTDVGTGSGAAEPSGDRSAGS
jgi:hypothetical protein